MKWCSDWIEIDGRLMGDCLQEDEFQSPAFRYSRNAAAVSLETWIQLISTIPHPTQAAIILRLDKTKMNSWGSTVVSIKEPSKLILQTCCRSRQTVVSKRVPVCIFTGAFFINFLVNGSLRSTGIIFVEVLDRFHADPALTAVIMAFLGCGYALFGKSQSTDASERA